AEHARPAGRLGHRASERGWMPSARQARAGRMRPGELIRNGVPPAPGPTGRPRQPEGAAPGQRQTAVGWEGAVPRGEPGDRSRTVLYPRVRRAGSGERSSSHSSPSWSVRAPMPSASPLSRSRSSTSRKRHESGPRGRSATTISARSNNFVTSSNPPICGCFYSTAAFSVALSGGRSSAPVDPRLRTGGPGRARTGGPCLSRRWRRRRAHAARQRGGVAAVGDKTTAAGPRRHTRCGCHSARQGAVAPAAQATDTVMCLSTLATVAPAALAEVVPELPRWYQLYVLSDRGVTRELVAAATEHGYEALVVTVDLPVLGVRERELRTPPRMDAADIPAAVAAGAAGSMTTPEFARLIDT